MQEVLLRHPRWSAPRLWRSEFRNYLAKEMRRGVLGMDQALELVTRAEVLLGEGEYDVPTPAVLDLCRRSRCTAYDAEFVVLALALGVPLVTGDRGILRAFPGIAVAPEAFAAGAR